MKRKKFGIGHPAFGFIFGLALAAIYISFENYISPAALSLFGSWWSWLQHVFFYLFLGVAMKLLLLRLLPKTIELKPMTPAAFAGLSVEAAAKASRTVVAPLPEVSGESQRIPRGDLPLDFGSIDKRTSELEHLGFALLSEGAMISNLKSSTPIFLRLFLHSQGSWAQISQGFPMGRAPLPVVLSFSTFLEEDWSVADSTQKGNWLLWMLRRAKGVGKGHLATASTSDMWFAHQEHCKRVTDKLGIHILHGSVEDYWRQFNVQLREMRKLLVRRSMFVAFLQTLGRRFTKRTEWWGDFDKAVQSTQQTV